MMLILVASHNRNLELARQVESAARAKGMEVVLLDLTELNLNLYTSRAEPQGPGTDFPQLHHALATAQALWFCAPEYNGGVPPSITNAIAWLSCSASDFRSLFNGKPVALSTHSGSVGQKVLSALRLQLSHLGCTVIGRELLSNAQKPANPDSISAMLDVLQKLVP